MAIFLMAVAARAEVAGPPPPPKAAMTAAQQAIALYHQAHDAAPPPKPCRGAKDEIIVCGQSDRLPLPDQSGPRPGPRTATGEMRSTAGGVGGSPMLPGKGAGLTFSIPFGRGKPEAPVKVTGNGEE